jgi:hypothetical protein
MSSARPAPAAGAAMPVPAFTRPARAAAARGPDVRAGCGVGGATRASAEAAARATAIARIMLDAREEAGVGGLYTYARVRMRMNFSPS